MTTLGRSLEHANDAAGAAHRKEGLDGAIVPRHLRFVGDDPDFVFEQARRLEPAADADHGAVAKKLLAKLG